MGIEIWLAVLVIMLVSLTGVLFINRFTKDFFEQRLPFLVSFSAGVFLVTAGALILEVFELSPSVVAGVMIVVGYLLAWLLQRLLPETHHHHDSDCVVHKGGAKKLIIGDGIHNIADGIVLITAFSVPPVS